MAYSTPTSVREAVAPGEYDMANPPDTASNTAADLSNVQLLDSIAEADATIDAYLGGRYAVPVVSVGGVVPHPIDYWSRNIAAYLGTLVLRKGKDFADTDPIARRYAMTMAALTAIRDGRSTLQIPDAPDAADSGSIRYNFDDTSVASGWVQLPTISSW